MTRADGWVEAEGKERDQQEALDVPSAIGCVHGGSPRARGPHWGASDGGRPPGVCRARGDRRAGLRGLPVLRCIRCLAVSLLFVFLHLKNMYLGEYNGQRLTHFQG